MEEKKYTESEWDYILDDTWYHNEYYDLMCSILQNGYPLERHESHAEEWWEKKSFTGYQMREILNRVESYWKDKVRTALVHALEGAE